ncbi:MAG TPA: hypothetical protein VFK43_05725 [Acidimicrobiales bacterium]|nr:hypothetical protein [Acidimicrobiales bacterium]
MPAIENAELKITPALSPAALWRIEVTYTLVVPYWEVGSWCRETAEVVEGDVDHAGAAVLRWRSDPWQIVAAGEPPDGAHFRIRRHVPAQLAGPSVLDVNPDGTAVDAIALPGEEPVVVVWLTDDRRLDRLHARIAVEPVAPTGDTAVTGVVTGQFGA